MATSPSLTIDSISNAIITDQGSSVSNGLISWSIAEQAEVQGAPAPTKSNYFTDTSGWSSRYYWSGKTGTTSFSGLSNTVTASISVTVYTKTIVATKSSVAVSSYSSESEAQAACDAVPGSAEYYYDWTYQASSNTYFVWRNDLSIDTTSNNVMVSKDVDVSNYITVRETPKPAYTISSVKYSSVTVSVSNLTAGDVVEMVVYDDFGDEVNAVSETATGSTLNLSIDGLEYGIEHSVVVYVNGSSLGTQYFTTLSPQQTYKYSTGEKSITVTVSNIGVGDQVAFFFRKKSDSTAVEKTYTRSTESDSSSYSWTEEVEWDIEYVYSIRVTYPDGDYVFLADGFTFLIPAPEAVYAVTRITSSSVTVVVEKVKSGSTVSLQVVGSSQSASGTAGSSGVVTLTVDNLEVGTEYIARVYVDGSNIDYGVQFYTLFDWWLSTVQQGEPMVIYNNTYPAPVTAQEWNRLVGLVNANCGTAISTVSSGDAMVAGYGGNIRLVADALGVSVDSGDRITAQFFLDLRDEINNML